MSPTTLTLLSTLMALALAMPIRRDNETYDGTLQYCDDINYQGTCHPMPFNRNNCCASQISRAIEELYLANKAVTQTRLRRITTTLLSPPMPRASPVHGPSTCVLRSRWSSC